MHLCHPTKSLVTSLQSSQRMSRRKAAEAGQDDKDAGGHMGWTPGAAKARQGGGGRRD